MGGLLTTQMTSRPAGSGPNARIKPTKRTDSEWKKEASQRSPDERSDIRDNSARRPACRCRSCGLLATSGPHRPNIVRMFLFRATKAAQPPDKIQLLPKTELRPHCLHGPSPWRPSRLLLAARPWQGSAQRCAVDSRDERKAVACAMPVAKLVWFVGNRTDSCQPAAEKACEQGMKHGRVLGELGRQASQMFVAVGFGVRLQFGEANRQCIGHSSKRNNHHFLHCMGTDEETLSRI